MRRYHLLPILCLLGAVICATMSSASATVVIKTFPGPKGSSSAFITISGDIDSTTLKEFSEAVASPVVKQSHFTSVYLDSPGGSVLDAMAIGEIIRTNGYSTIVMYPGPCASACVLILASGVIRECVGKVAIHRPHFDEKVFAQLSQTEAQAKYAQMGDAVRQYLSRMGMPDTLYTAMLRVSSDDVQYLSEEEIVAYGLEGEDPAWSEWHRAQMIQSMGVEKYAYQKSRGAIMSACLKTTSDTQKCISDVWREFDDTVKSCSSYSGDKYVACVNVIEKNMIQKYTE
ncbi:MAG: ATP-dependent Clp protease proteolytic subunit [Candidatus Solibacter sp.]